MHAVWIEIPVKDLDRAMAFYQAVFQSEPTEVFDEGVRRTTTLANTTEGGRAGISLNQTANFAPSDKGVFVYIDLGDKLSAALERVTAAGGTVVEEKTSMGDAGNYASIKDTEGNLLALYSAT
ncbi:VOC family protein [Candidatus Gracilibacteria bacterium]|nr:VOC family protein [Candidatus Gracilibacteria bacterium]